MTSLLEPRSIRSVSERSGFARSLFGLLSWRVAEREGERMALKFRKSTCESKMPTIPIPQDLSAWLLRLIAHDLRTPLNVISLSLRMIDESVRSEGLEIADIDVAEQNVCQLARILNVVSDLARVIEGSAACEPAKLVPGRWIAEIAQSVPVDSLVEVSVTIDPSCPAEVWIDQATARIALEHAIAGAIAAAEGAPVAIKAVGTGDMWGVDITTERASISKPETYEIDPDFPLDQWIGSNTRRASLDLFLTARICRSLGGKTIVEVSPEDKQSTTRIVWPVGRPGSVRRTT
jgi:K+-sensing histidine kinase KdpD